MGTSGNINSSAEISAKSLSTVKQHVKPVSYLLDKAVRHFAINSVSSFFSQMHARRVNHDL